MKADNWYMALTKEEKVYFQQSMNFTPARFKSFVNRLKFIQERDNSGYDWGKRNVSRFLGHLPEYIRDEYSEKFLNKVMELIKLHNKQKRIDSIRCMDDGLKTIAHIHLLFRSNGMYLYGGQTSRAVIPTSDCNDPNMTELGGFFNTPTLVRVNSLYKLPVKEYYTTDDIEDIKKTIEERFACAKIVFKAILPLHEEEYPLSFRFNDGKLDMILARRKRYEYSGNFFYMSCFKSFSYSFKKIMKLNSPEKLREEIVKHVKEEYFSDKMVEWYKNCTKDINGGYSINYRRFKVMLENYSNNELVKNFISKVNQ